MESKNSYSENCIIPEKSKLLGECLHEVDRSVKQMLKLIQEDGVSFASKDEYQDKKPKLIAHVKEFYSMYQTLSERYNLLTREPTGDISSEIQILESESPIPDYDESSFCTPNGKPSAYKSVNQVLGLDMQLSSGGGTSDLSLKNGSESSSPLSSDSEYETFYSIKKNSTPSLDDDPRRLLKNIKFLENVLSIKEKLQMTEEEILGSILKAEEYGNYEELIERITNYEEENIALKQKLHFSEEEFAILKSELKKKESLTENSVARQAVEMQHQVIELSTQVSECNDKIRVLEVELEFYISTNKGLEEEIVKLKEHVRDVSENSHNLQSQIEFALKDIAKLEAGLDSERKLVYELQELKSDLQVENSYISEQIITLEETLEKSEFQKKSLQGEIRLLKEEHAEKSDVVEVLNKDLDMLKLKYDMVMAEKDELTAKIQTNIAKLSSHNNIFRQLEEDRARLSTEYWELITKSNTDQMVIKELQLSVDDLKEELSEKSIMISEMAEEKKEAIRQLCFALEYYRSRYHELGQAFTGHKRLAVIA